MLYRTILTYATSEEPLRQLLGELVAFIGRRHNETLQYMGYIMFSNLIKIVSEDTAIAIHQKLIEKLEHDGAIGMAIDSFKSFVLSYKGGKPSFNLKGIIEKFFEIHIKDLEKNMLEKKQTINSLLVLYKAALLKDKALKIFEIANNKEFQAKIRTTYLNPIVETVKVIVGEKLPKGNETNISEDFINAYKNERNQLEIFRFLIADIEADD